MMIYQRGFGVIEIMISIALLGAGSYLVMNGLSLMTDSKKEIDGSIALNSVVSNIVESVRLNVAMEKIDFQAEKFLNPTRLGEVNSLLKSCWNRSGIYEPKSGEICEGRIGYVVTPYKVGPMTLLGLYQVTIRVTHVSLLPRRFKQFEFIVRGP